MPRPHGRGTPRPYAGGGRQDRDEPVLGRAGRPGRDRAPVLQHGKGDAAADQAGERAGEIGRTRLPLHLPAERRQPAAQGPVHARHRERVEEGGPDRRVARARAKHAHERLGRQAVEAREPGAVDDADAADRDARIAHRGDDETAAAGRCPHLARRGEKLLEQHLRVEVVALPVHPLHDPGERLGDVRGQRHRLRRCDAEARPAADRDAVADERVPERAGGEERRRERRPAKRPVDDQGRERGSLAADEVRLPACHAALPVVERLVAEDPAADRADPTPPDRRREAIEVGGGECRIAESLQDEIAVPPGSVPAADAVHLGMEPVPGPESGERRPRDGDLLVRRRCDGQRGVVREHDGSRRHVHGERRGATQRERRGCQRLRQLRLDRRRPGGRRGRHGRNQGDRHDDEHERASHRLNRRS